MRFIIFFLIGMCLISTESRAMSYAIGDENILNVYLNIGPNSNNPYTIHYYDSVLLSSQSTRDKFFCHLAKSLRLAYHDIPLATAELIEAKTYFSTQKGLVKFRHHLEVVEANLYLHLSKYEKANTIIDYAILGFNNVGSKAMVNIARLTKANNLINWDKYDEGFKVVEELFRTFDPNLFVNKGLSKAYEMALWNRRATLMTAISNVRKDSIPQAKIILQKTIELAKAYNDESVYSNATGNLSYIHYLNEEYEQMIPLALEDLAYSKRLKNVESIGGLHTILADAYYNVGKKDSAGYHFKKAEEYAKYFRSKFFYNTFVEVAQKYYKQSGDLNAAFESLNMQYEAINAIHKSINQINFDLSKAENNLIQAEERIHLLDEQNRQNIIINWLLGLLVLSIGAMAFVFYRLHGTQKRFRDKLEQLNQSLESEIERRTKKVVEQSEKIKAAAYHNSHRTRAPVARLLGLVDILNTELPSEREEIAEYIRQSAREIDEVIIDMNEVLSSDRPD